MGTRQLVSLATAAALLLTASACAPVSDPPPATPSVAEVIAHAHDDIDDKRQVFTAQGVGSVEFSVGPEDFVAAFGEASVAEGRLFLLTSCTGEEEAAGTINGEQWGIVSCGYDTSAASFDENGKVTAAPQGGVTVSKDRLSPLSESYSVEVVAGEGEHIVVSLLVQSDDEVD